MELEHGHNQAAIATRIAKGQRSSYVRDYVYGGIDGAITTFAIVAGVFGAALSSNIILILGLANLLADGFSMAASNYSGTKTLIDDVDRVRKIEEKHIRFKPDGEREEVRQLLKRKGFKGETLDETVAVITSNKAVWIDFMLVEEYGLSLNQPSPFLSGLATFVAFVICGSVPILPFVFDMKSAIYGSAILTGMMFFVIGAAKSNWTMSPWWRSGFETVLIGGFAATVAFAVGRFLNGLV